MKGNLIRLKNRPVSVCFLAKRLKEGYARIERSDAPTDNQRLAAASLRGCTTPRWTDT